MAGLTYISGPTSEMLGLDEAKRHMRVTTNDDDDLIIGWIIVARHQCEKITKRSFGLQTWRQTLDAFPYGRFVVLPKVPLVSVTSITYVDQFFATQTFATSNYTVVIDQGVGHVQLDYDANWPDINPQPDAITITFTVGETPPMVKAAMKLIVGDLYQNRETKILGISDVVENSTVCNLLAPYTMYYMR